MCALVNIENGDKKFELELKEQHTIVLDSGTESRKLLLEILGRMEKTVRISTDNGMEVEFLGISQFDNKSGLCQKEIQKRYFGISEEGEERFHFFLISSEQKNKERYQRMLEGVWKAQLDAQKNDGAKIIIADAEDYIKTPEFKALYNMDKLNYYVLISRVGVSKEDYGVERFYKFEFSDGVHRLV